MNLFELSAKISVDDSAFKKSMENAQKVSKNVANAMKELQSPLDKAKSGFNAIAHPVETAKANIEKLKSATEAIRHPIETFKNKVADASTALETKRNKLSTLAAGYDSAKKKVADITKEFNKSAKESGTSSQKTQELAKRLNEAEKEAEEAKKELDDYSASVSKAGKNSDSASKSVGSFASKLGKGIATAGKIGVAAVGAAAAGITALTTAAVNNYAEYEQLVGGVETLFKGSADTVMKYAENAYKTAGMSDNEYMSTVTGFSAALLRSVGGDTEKAAKLADTAITDMSDNANKTGVSLESLQNAYTGFSRGNFTMLDNLALGFSGTKEGMQELLDTAKELSGVEYDIESYADIVEAIHVVQTEMGITGTTAKEAASTIQGSVSMMKSAWANLVTGIADENADLERLIEDFVESTGVAVGNILPKVHKALTGAAKLVETLIPVIMEEIPVLIGETLPQILQAGVGVIETILRGISSQPDEIVATIFKVIDILIDAIIDLLPEIVATGILLIGKLAVGLVKAIPDLVAKIPEIIKSVVNSFKSRSGEFSGIGRDIVNGIWSGIKSMISTFTANVKNFFSGIVNSVKQTLGIRSPSRVFAEIGGFMAEGVSQGWDNQFDDVKKDINKSLSFDDASIRIGASVQKIGNGIADSTYGGFSIGNININIEGAKYSDERSLAAAIAQEIQNMADREAAVYA